MLNRQKLVVELAQLANSLFKDYSAEHELLIEAWRRIAADSAFMYRARAAHAPWPVPSWQGVLNETIPVAHPMNNYCIVSVDGSQIYPDRHQQFSCFLINSGTVVLQYAPTGSSVLLDSRPYLFASQDDEYALPMSVQVVNCLRHEYEFNDGMKAAEAQLPIAQQKGQPLVLVFDGSLIFWHLEAQDEQLKDMFLAKYVSVLHQLYQKKITTVSYISYPKSRELINLVRLELCNFDTNDTQKMKPADHAVDTTILKSFLPEYHRSIVFKNHSAISQLYPDHVSPYFFYLHVGHEIGRVEIPAWIALDEAQVDMVAQVILDQSIKGGGYPVALAEAHEQAVVKGPDREFFYHLLAKMGIERKQQIHNSQKALHKRRMGI